MKFYSKPPKKEYATKKTDVYHFDDIWSLDMLDLNNYGVENTRRYRCVLVIIDIFSKLCWTVSLKNKNAQTIKHFFESTIIISKNKPSLIETDDVGEVVSKIFSDFIKENNNER